MKTRQSDALFAPILWIASWARGLLRTRKRTDSANTCFQGGVLGPDHAADLAQRYGEAPNAYPVLQMLAERPMIKSED